MQQRFILGRVIATDSWVHKLDPRAKMTCMLIFAVITVLLHSLVDFVAVTIVSQLILLSTRIKLTMFWKAVRPLRYLMLFIFLFQLFLEKGGHLLLSWGPIQFYSEGIITAVFTVWRMSLLVTFTALLTFTTTPAMLTQALEDMLKPLKIFRISPQAIALMLSIALRFIPTILEETERIVKAQASRGADLKDLPWKDKAKAMIALLVPVTVCAFRRAEELVNSMEARGYKLGEPRSKFFRLTWHRQDTYFLLIFILIGLFVIWQ
ncbi:energy-coupling factor transporter transmembrane component T family protein [Paenibacillus terrigena]|uniref:energy-coupling factor transporter transmembrane component T family protein n=1 Tax=Paenibacillus terrigena TaxID=369333 RepID=UPI000367F52F|nr:energy-coupling factor transporter transmembrane component T [Paenibacillus terrigena]